MSQYRRRIPPIATAAGATGTAPVHDDNDATGMPHAAFVGPKACWVTVSLKLDAAVTLIHKWAPDPNATDSALLIINGTTEAGEVAAANAFFQRSLRLQPGRNKIYVLNNGAAPTANKIAAEYNDYPGIIQ
jgi:hypothetical protein